MKSAICHNSTKGILQFHLSIFGWKITWESIRCCVFQSVWLPVHFISRPCKMVVGCSLGQQFVKRMIKMIFIHFQFKIQKPHETLSKVDSAVAAKVKTMKVKRYTAGGNINHTHVVKLCPVHLIKVHCILFFISHYKSHASCTWHSLKALYVMKYSVLLHRYMHLYHCIYSIS